MAGAVADPVVFRGGEGGGGVGSDNGIVDILEIVDIVVLCCLELRSRRFASHRDALRIA